MSTYLLLGLVFVAAIADWAAVARGWRRVELVCKPATLVLLFGWLFVQTRMQGVPLWFGIGLLFSLAGDVLLMFSDRWFVPGLAAFLLAHLGYIAGFNIPMPNVPVIWSLGMAVVLGLGSARLLRRITSGLASRNLRRLSGPVLLYGMVITIMLLSALLTLMRTDWKAGAALMVAAGAVLFYFSDGILAWNKFVAPVKNGRVVNMIAYHLGQILLIAGAVMQFGK